MISSRPIGRAFKYAPLPPLRPRRQLLSSRPHRLLRPAIVLPLNCIFLYVTPPTFTCRIAWQACVTIRIWKTHGRSGTRMEFKWFEGRAPFTPRWARTARPSSSPSATHTSSLHQPLLLVHRTDVPASQEA